MQAALWEERAALELAKLPIPLHGEPNFSVNCMKTFRDQILNSNCEGSKQYCKIAFDFSRCTALCSKTLILIKNNWLCLSAVIKCTLTSPARKIFDAGNVCQIYEKHALYMSINTTRWSSLNINISIATEEEKLVYKLVKIYRF